MLPTRCLLYHQILSTQWPKLTTVDNYYSTKCVSSTICNQLEFGRWRHFTPLQRTLHCTLTPLCNWNNRRLNVIQGHFKKQVGVSNPLRNQKSNKNCKYFSSNFVFSIHLFQMLFRSYVNFILNKVKCIVMAFSCILFYSMLMDEAKQKFKVLNSLIR